VWGFLRFFLKLQRPDNMISAIQKQMVFLKEQQYIVKEVDSIVI